MKKIVILSIFLLMAFSLFAHPAQEVTAKYSHKTKLLKLEFEHQVRYPEEHYISQVQIEVNTKIIITQILSKQEDTWGGKLVFKIPDLKKGDQVKIITECSEYGKKSTEFEVE